MNREGPSKIVNREGPSKIVNREGPSNIVNREGPSKIVNREGPSKIVNTLCTNLHVFQDHFKGGALSAAVVVWRELDRAGGWYALLIPLQHRQ